MGKVLTDTKRSSRNFFAKMIEIREIGVIIPLLVCIVLFSILNSRFYGMENIINIFRTYLYSFDKTSINFANCVGK